MKNFLSIQFVIFCVTFGFLEASNRKHNLEEEQNLLTQTNKRIKGETGENQVSGEIFFTQLPRPIISLILAPLSMREKLNCSVLNKPIKKLLDPIVFKKITFPPVETTQNVNQIIKIMKKNAKFVEEINFSLGSWEKSSNDLSELWSHLPEALRKLKYSESEKRGLTQSYFNKEDFKSILHGKSISHIELYLEDWSPFVNEECDYDCIKRNKFIQLIPDDSLEFCCFDGFLKDDIRRATIFDIALISHKFSKKRPGTLILSHFCLSKQDILTDETPVAWDTKLTEIIIKELWIEDKAPSIDFFKHLKYLKKLTIEKIFMVDKLSLLFYDLKSFYYNELAPCFENEKPAIPFKLFTTNESPLPIEIITQNE